MMDLMQVIHLENPKNHAHVMALAQDVAPTAMTIGNFDGVHLGHAQMIGTLKSIANNHHLLSAVMIFEPQPKEFFNPNNPPARISSLAEKLARFDALGVDVVIVASFDDAFRQLSAHDFADILRLFRAQHLILGDDFRFGQGRSGDEKFLQAEGFVVHNMHTITHNNTRISSTAIRALLACGNLAAANDLLGYEYAIEGQVVAGNQLGRTLGFPTANIALNRLKPALTGIYGAAVTSTDLPLSSMGGLALADGAVFGCVNIGVRPSVDLGDEWRCEVYLPEFQGNLYDKTLKLTFLHYLHPEKKYDGLSALTIGISQDVEALTAWYHAHRLRA